MALVIVVVFINIQLITDESLSEFSQSNQRSLYENEYVRNAVICVLIRIAQLVEHLAESDQLTFIKRHCTFETRKLLLLLFCIYSFFFFHFFIMFFFLLYVYFIFCNSFYYLQFIYTN